MDKYLDIYGGSVNSVLQDVDDECHAFTDLVVIGFQEDRIVFVGDTGILSEQQQELLRLAFSRWLSE